jgi:hypothetical protein
MGMCSGRFQGENSGHTKIFGMASASDRQTSVGSIAIALIHIEKNYADCTSDLGNLRQPLRRQRK